MNKTTKSKKTTTKPKETKETDEYYTKEEIKRLDKFQALTENKFDDTEIYDLMIKYKNDDDAILKELKEQLNEKMRGEGEWQDIGKRNYIFYNIILY
jgi:hypothetical protein